MPYAIDLFCGAGGMSEGLIRAGFDILFSNDLSKEAGETYVARHKQLGYLQGVDTFFYLGDVHSLSGELIWEKIRSLKRFSSGNPAPARIDAIFGGPPCQGFSKAGRRRKNDPRNFLFREYVRIINEIKPTYVVMENVTGFLDTKLPDFVSADKSTYDEKTCTAPHILESELGKIGYDVLPKRILKAEEFGVPQKRHRVIFIAHLRGTPAPAYPVPASNQREVTLEEAVSDLCEKPKKNGKPTSYQLASIAGRTPAKSGSPIPAATESNTDVSKHTLRVTERFSLFKEGESGKDVRDRIRSNGISLVGKDELLGICSSSLGITPDDAVKLYSTPPVSDEALDDLLTKKNVRVKLKKNEPSPTVMTIPDDYISPFSQRTFSVRELARLQSFDDSFVFLGGRTTGGPRRKKEVPQYTQVGNAVPPILAYEIAKSIIAVIGR